MDILFYFPVFMENLACLLNVMIGKIGLCAHSLLLGYQKTVLARIHHLAEGVSHEKIQKDKEKAIYDQHLNWKQPGTIN